MNVSSELTSNIDERQLVEVRKRCASKRVADGREAGGYDNARRSAYGAFGTQQNVALKDAKAGYLGMNKTSCRNRLYYLSVKIGEGRKRDAQRQAWRLRNHHA
jgi:hypothetical protein